MNRFFFALFFSLAPASQAAERPSSGHSLRRRHGRGRRFLRGSQGEDSNTHLDRLASQE